MPAAKPEPDRTEFVAALLEKIPRSDAEALTLQELCRAICSDEPQYLNWSLATLTLLEVLDTLTVLPGASPKETKLKAKSQTALYLLRSLAIYLRCGLRLVSDWKRAGVGENMPGAHAITSGAQLVYVMEKLRLAKQTVANTTREVWVSHTLIKAKVRGRWHPSYLVQYDGRADQFQLIGGRMRSSDRNSLSTMKREIEEELRGNQLGFPADYDLHEIAADIPFQQLSPTYGAYTKYNFTVYHAYFKIAQLRLGPNDRWVTLSELLSGKTKDQRKIAHEVPQIVDNKLAGGLAKLPLSIDNVQNMPMGSLAREHLWEVVAVTIGLLGLIATIVTFLLE